MSNTKFGIVCVGVAVHDLVFGLQHLPVREGKYRARELTSTGGGMAASAAAAIAQLGAPVELWSRLGDDAIADTITAELQSFGVNTLWCKRNAGARSSLSAVMVDQRGERLIVNYTDPDIDAGAAWLPIERIANSTAVLVDTRWETGAIAALDAASKANIPSVLDADSAPVPLSLLQRASHCVFSASALADFAKTNGANTNDTKTDDADTQHANTNDVIAGLDYVAQHTLGIPAVTLGAEGIYWRQADGIHHQPAFPVTVVDTLGAGDVFHGALAMALGEMQSLAQSMRFAAACAAIKCTRFGGRQGVPERHEVEQLLRQTPDAHPAPLEL